VEQHATPGMLHNVLRLLPDAILRAPTTPSSSEHTATISDSSRLLFPALVTVGDGRSLGSSSS
jgi:hypothetical protein